LTFSDWSAAGSKGGFSSFRGFSLKTKSFGAQILIVLTYLDATLWLFSQPVKSANSRAFKTDLVPTFTMSVTGSATVRTAVMNWTAVNN